MFVVVLGGVTGKALSCTFVIELVLDVVVLVKFYFCAVGIYVPQCLVKTFPRLQFVERIVHLVAPVGSLTEIIDSLPFLTESQQRSTVLVQRDSQRLNISRLTEIRYYGIENLNCFGILAHTSQNCSLLCKSDIKVWLPILLTLKRYSTVGIFESLVEMSERELRFRQGSASARNSGWVTGLFGIHQSLLHINKSLLRLLSGNIDRTYDVERRTYAVGVTRFAVNLVTMLAVLDRLVVVCQTHIADSKHAQALALVLLVATGLQKRQSNQAVIGTLVVTPCCQVPFASPKTDGLAQSVGRNTIIKNNTTIGYLRISKAVHQFVCHLDGRILVKYRQQRINLVTFGDIRSRQNAQQHQYQQLCSSHFQITFY